MATSPAAFTFRGGGNLPPSVGAKVSGAKVIPTGAGGGPLQSALGRLLQAGHHPPPGSREPEKTLPTEPSLFGLPFWRRAALRVGAAKLHGVSTSRAPTVSGRPLGWGNRRKLSLPQELNLLYAALSGANAAHRIGTAWPTVRSAKRQRPPVSRETCARARLSLAPVCPARSRPRSL